MSGRSRLDINWTDKDVVIALAKSFGHGFTVYKNPTRQNYNICHTVNEFRLKIHAEWVVHRT